MRTLSTVFVCALLCAGPLQAQEEAPTEAATGEPNVEISAPAPVVRPVKRRPPRNRPSYKTLGHLATVNKVGRYAVSTGGDGAAVMNKMAWDGGRARKIGVNGPDGGGGGKQSTVWTPSTQQQPEYGPLFEDPEKIVEPAVPVGRNVTPWQGLIDKAQLLMKRAGQLLSVASITVFTGEQLAKTGFGGAAGAGMIAAGTAMAAAAAALAGVATVLGGIILLKYKQKLQGAVITVSALALTISAIMAAKGNKAAYSKYAGARGRVTVEAAAAARKGMLRTIFASRAGLGAIKTGANFFIGDTKAGSYMNAAFGLYDGISGLGSGNVKKGIQGALGLAQTWQGLAPTKGQTGQILRTALTGAQTATDMWKDKSGNDKAKPDKKAKPDAAAAPGQVTAAVDANGQPIAAAPGRGIRTIVNGQAFVNGQPIDANGRPIVAAATVPSAPPASNAATALSATTGVFFPPGSISFGRGASGASGLGPAGKNFNFMGGSANPPSPLFNRNFFGASPPLNASINALTFPTLSLIPARPAGQNLFSTGLLLPRSTTPSPLNAGLNAPSLTSFSLFPAKPANPFNFFGASLNSNRTNAAPAVPTIPVSGLDPSSLPGTTAPPPPVRAAPAAAGKLNPVFNSSSISSQYSELRSVILPDGSNVVLGRDAKGGWTSWDAAGRFTGQRTNAQANAMLTANPNTQTDLSRQYAAAAAQRREMERGYQQAIAEAQAIGLLDAQGSPIRAPAPRPAPSRPVPPQPAESWINPTVAALPGAVGSVVRDYLRSPTAMVKEAVNANVTVAGAVARTTTRGVLAIDARARQNIPGYSAVQEIAVPVVTAGGQLLAPPFKVVGNALGATAGAGGVFVGGVARIAQVGAYAVGANDFGQLMGRTSENITRQSLALVGNSVRGGFNALAEPVLMVGNGVSDTARYAVTGRITNRPGGNELFSGGQEGYFSRAFNAADNAVRNDPNVRRTSADSQAMFQANNGYEATLRDSGRFGLTYGGPIGTALAANAVITNGAAKAVEAYFGSKFLGAATLSPAAAAEAGMARNALSFTSRVAGQAGVPAVGLGLAQQTLGAAKETNRLIQSGAPADEVRGAIFETTFDAAGTIGMFGGAKVLKNAQAVPSAPREPGGLNTREPAAGRPASEPTASAQREVAAAPDAAPRASGVPPAGSGAPANPFTQAIKDAPPIPGARIRGLISIVDGNGKVYAFPEAQVPPTFIAEVRAGRADAFVVSVDPKGRVRGLMNANPEGRPPLTGSVKSFNSAAERANGGQWLEGPRGEAIFRPDGYNNIDVNAGRKGFDRYATADERIQASARQPAASETPLPSQRAAAQEAPAAAPAETAGATRQPRAPGRQPDGTYMPRERGRAGYNEAVLQGDQFARVLTNESVGGNAGTARAAVNAVVDSRGTIVEVGNVQDFSPAILARRARGELRDVTFKARPLEGGTIESVLVDPRLTPEARANLTRAVDARNAAIRQQPVSPEMAAFQERMNVKPEPLPSGTDLVVELAPRGSRAPAPRPRVSAEPEPLARPQAAGNGRPNAARAPPNGSGQAALEMPAAQLDMGRMVRASEAIKRPISPQEQMAVQKAHEIGGGQIGRDGGPAAINNYTQAQVREKARILQDAGFSASERRILMEKGITGNEPAPQRQSTAQRQTLGTESPVRTADTLVRSPLRTGSELLRKERTRMRWPILKEAREVMTGREPVIGDIMSLQIGVTRLKDGTLDFYSGDIVGGASKMRVDLNVRTGEFEIVGVAGDQWKGVNLVDSTGRLDLEIIKTEPWFDPSGENIR